MIDCHRTASDISLHATSSNARARGTIFVSVCFFAGFHNVLISLRRNFRLCILKPFSVLYLSMFNKLG